MFECSLPESQKIYNEFHALIVKLGKEYCRKKPLCSICPLKNDLIQYFKKGDLSTLNETLRINTIAALTKEKLLYA
jgi:adenine-specific DNA glycosylase